MPLVKTSAIVLSAKPLGEADKLITLFTPGHGRVRATAKGSRRIGNRFGSALEPFTHCQVILFQKHRDSLYRIQQADVLRSFRELREDLDCILRASRATSLMSSMLAEGDTNPVLFRILYETLASLRGPDGEWEVRMFEIRLLQHAGYQPRLEAEQCLRCRGRLGGGDLYFSPASGGIICRACREREHSPAQPITKGAVALIRQAIRISPRLAPRIRVTPVMKEEIRNLLESYFDHLLERS